MRPVRPTPQAATDQPVTKPALASGTNVAHHAELVPNLEADHRKLLRIFAAVGKVLSERIQREESMLYPLYLPHY